MAIAVAWAGALLAVAAWTTGQVPVTVDGRPHLVAAAATVSDLAAAGLTLAPAGDIVSLAGSIAARGRGGDPRVTVDGRPSQRLERIHAGAVVVSRRGLDVRERAEVRLVAVPIPRRVSGTGPDLVVVGIGAPGLTRVRRGEISHEVVESSVLRLPVPMVMRRQPFPPGTPLVALTFDDGPWPGQTERVLEILRDQGVRATFFMVGVRVRRAPALARAVVEGGHLVGNHTQTHQMLARATPAQVASQIRMGAQTIRDLAGVETHWFRAPGGVLTPVVRAEAASVGQRIAGWTVDPGDWRKPKAGVIVRGVLKATRPGAIVLLHDGGGDRASTIEALPAVIEGLRALGYRFVTLDGL